MMFPKLKTAFLTLVMAVAIPTLAFAADLDSLRNAGKVGERPDGMLGYVTTPDSATKQAVEEINAARASAYKKLAAKQGVSVDTVQAIAGEKQIRRLQSGNYYMDDAGNWQRK